MFREIGRNKKQILSEEVCISILSNCTSGVLSVLGDDDYPYGVPMSYAYKDGRLYFHGMPRGHKIDSIKKNDKVSFTVIETDQIVPEEYTTYFRSVIVFGRAHILDNPKDQAEALSLLVDKYSANYKEASYEEIRDKLNAVCTFVIDIEHVSGKEAIEFAERKD